MPAVDDLLQRHQQVAERSAPSVQGAVPGLHVTVVTCMDTRIDPMEVLGLKLGEVHVLRNAGGIVTDDVIRSLSISQRRLQTREVMVIQHTRCGMATLTEDEFRDELERETGLRPTWAVEAFREVTDSVRQSVERARRSPYLLHTDQIRGYVYDVETGALSEVA
ncbi:carbonic anhydrase [Longimycelium tulufanense]|uniref:carbonic anhydrase n=1 Tax=Longimycelium tulufanense TaxID=907463 RepID=A0A8J3CBU7_9PSEU|nr:carbonic anhydrase [Longimycelium tulufanense]GGM44572.1 carbonic anhydrase [Longimycelium tulufanense]